LSRLTGLSALSSFFSLEPEELLLLFEIEELLVLFKESVSSAKN